MADAHYIAVDLGSLAVSSSQFWPDLRMFMLEEVSEASRVGLNCKGPGMAILSKLDPHEYVEFLDGKNVNNMKNK